MTTAKTSETTAENGLTAAVQVLDLAEGIYFFSVRSGTPVPVAGAGNLTLPAVHVSLGPGASFKEVEFMPGPNTFGTWLCAAGDSLVAKVNAASVGVVLTSLRAPGGETLAIDVERLGATGPSVLNELGAQTAGRDIAAEPLTEVEDPAKPALPIQVVAHIRNRGDVTFSDVGWAGRVAPGLSIEAFAVNPLQSLSPTDIEYKALTATGIETPWVGSGAFCGTRGLAVPLVGFAVRLKQEANLRYECVYSGYFQSGIVVGPLGNGQPCRSTRPNDPLEGIRIRITRRETTTEPNSVAQSLPSKSAIRADQSKRGQQRIRKAAVAAAQPKSTKPGLARKSAKTG